MKSRSEWLIGSLMDRHSELVVIGGCGHVGLPLAIVAAHAGRWTTICDTDANAVSLVMGGKTPFLEDGAEPLLAKGLASGRLTATTDPAVVGRADIVVIVIGTPIDEHLTPRMNVIFDVLREYLRHFKSGQLLVLRSTVYPGVSAKVQEFFDEKGLDVAVAFCPERVAQGNVIREFSELPQIASVFSERGLQGANNSFDPSRSASSL